MVCSVAMLLSAFSVTTEDRDDVLVLCYHLELCGCLLALLLSEAMFMSMTCAVTKDHDGVYSGPC